VAIGVDILSPIPFAVPVLEVVRSHHERWDGLGYPQGLKGEQTPIGARIISIVDVFDAVTSDRPYRKAMTHEEALEVLKQGSGKQFDPLLVELFIEVLPQARLEIQQMEAAQRRRARASGEDADASHALTHIKHAAAEMAAVADVAHALSLQDTLDGITDVVADKTLSLLPADTVVIFLKDPENRELVASSVRGRYDEKLSTMTISLGEGVTGWVVANQQAKVNASAALDVARRFSPEENIELSAVTAVPLVHGPETLGAIAVYTMGYSVIQEPHVYLLNTIAEHLAGAIQNQLRFVEHRDMAFTDPLTGLVNSRGVYKEMERLVATGNSDLRECFSVLMMDLDRFKEVNDTLGHLRGDDLLRTVASSLSSVSRPNDIVCRYAGDEFVMILPGVRPDQAERIARRAQEAIECLPAVEGKIQIGASIGLASFPLDGKDSRDLLHAADLRMYEDKLRRKSGHQLTERLRLDFEETRVPVGV
jgi:diguanylate cyclase (GGDEF)-like protein